MNEYHIMNTGLVGLLSLMAGSYLYALGGRKNKAWRRFVAAFVLMLGVNIEAYLMHNWSPWLTLIFPILATGFSMGYGSDTTGGKIVRRTLVVLVVMLSSVLCSVVYGGNAWGDAWNILILCVWTGMWSVWLGIKNPVYAPIEEMFVCILLTSGLMLFPFTKG